MFMQVLYSRLSEKDRRRYAAVESLKLGRGGMAYVSEILGIDRGTILEGKKELEAPDPIPEDRQRKMGGGRKKNDQPS